MHFAPATLSCSVSTICHNNTVYIDLDTFAESGHNFGDAGAEDIIVNDAFEEFTGFDAGSIDAGVSDDASELDFGGDNADGAASDASGSSVDTAGSGGMVPRQSSAWDGVSNALRSLGGQQVSLK